MSTRLALTLLLAVTAGCGQIKLGSVPAPNEAAPAGTIVAQGPFQAENGQTNIQGTAIIYKVSADSTFLVRIEGVTFPSESGLTLVAKANGAVAATFNLRSSSGSQNYATPITDNRIWNSVALHSTSKNLDYANATLH